MKCQECKEEYKKRHICKNSSTSLFDRLNYVLSALDDIEEKIDEFMKPTNTFTSLVWTPGYNMLDSYGGMCYGGDSVFGDNPVWWVGNDTGDWWVFGPDRVLGCRYEEGKPNKYQLTPEGCMLTTACSTSEYVYYTKEEANAKCKELNEKR